MLIRIDPISSESVHLYNRIYLLILVGDSSCDTNDSGDDVTMMVDVQGHKVCGESTWENIERQKVIEIPFNIDGMKVYSIKGSNRTDLLRRCRDDQPWKKDSRAMWSRYGTVRFKDCNGSLRCPNPNCPFILKFEERNRLKFNSSRICELCGALGEAVACPARKYTAYISEKKAQIFHFGTHSCKTKFVDNRPTDIVAAAISVDLKNKPSQIQGNAILTAIRKRKSWIEVEKVAKQLTDKRAISNEKIKQRQQALPYGEGYEAIRERRL